MLKRILETLDGLDESLHKFYEKGDDGKFHLDVEPEDTSELKTALERERENVATLKRENGTLKTQVTEAQEEAKRASKSTGKVDKEAVKAEVEAQTQELVQKHADEIGKKDERISTLTSNISRTLKDSAALDAITSAKGIPQLLLPVVKDRLSVSEVDGKFEVEVLNSDGQRALSRKPGSGTAPMSVKELVESLREDENYGRAFLGDEASGTGSSSDGGKPKPTSIRSRADLKTPADKASYIREHGQEAYLELPVEAASQ